MELQIEGRNVEIRNSWQEKINEEKERLDRHHPGLVHHLRVAIEETSGHKSGGFEVRLVAGVPNDTLVVTRKGESARPLLVEAFDTLGLQLKELQRKRRQTGKVVEEGSGTHLVGTVKALFPEEAYGFLVTPDGEEVYFHEHALKDLTLEHLAEGVAVHFGLGEGDKGPTAAWVRVGR
ncbi:MAG: HPF/RaiA family ribosome-associated protein [Thermodesulfobacteriota bacterium]